MTIPELQRYLTETVQVELTEAQAILTRFLADDILRGPWMPRALEREATVAQAALVGLLTIVATTLTDLAWFAEKTAPTRTPQLAPKEPD